MDTRGGREWKTDISMIQLLKKKIEFMVDLTAVGSIIFVGDCGGLWGLGGNMI